MKAYPSNTSRTIVALSFVMVGFLLVSSMAEEARTLPSDASKVQPLLVGSDVPDVTLQTVGGEPYALRDAVKEKPAVVIFYRGGWCPYCSTHLGAIRDIEQKLIGMGYQVLAVSPDSPATLQASPPAEPVNYTVLSDARVTAAEAFGIAFKVSDDLLGVYKGYGIDLEAASGESHHALPVPAAFIVGQDAKIKFAYVNPDYKVRINSDVLLAAARAALPKE